MRQPGLFDKQVILVTLEISMLPLFLRINIFSDNFDVFNWNTSSFIHIAIW